MNYEWQPVKIKREPIQFNLNTKVFVRIEKNSLQNFFKTSKIENMSHNAATQTITVKDEKENANLIPQQTDNVNNIALKSIKSENDDHNSYEEEVKRKMFQNNVNKQANGNDTPSDFNEKPNKRVRRTETISNNDNASSARIRVRSIKQESFIGERIETFLSDNNLQTVKGKSRRKKQAKKEKILTNVKIKQKMMHDKKNKHQAKDVPKILQNTKSNDDQMKNSKKDQKVAKHNKPNIISSKQLLSSSSSIKKSSRRATNIKIIENNHCGGDDDKQEEKLEKNSFQCLICKKILKTSSTLKKHKIIHTGQRPYKCLTCNKTFTKKYSLTVHERLHSGEKPYKCSTCGKKFIRNSDLQIHMRFHTGEKPFKCNICKRKFRANSVLSRHKATHTGEKPYECVICKKRFARNYDLKIHKRLHTDEKSHK